VPPLAESRVRDFYGGVYKRFLVNGPAALTFSVRKGDSVNTILSGVFLDDWALDCPYKVVLRHTAEMDPIHGFEKGDARFQRKRTDRVSSYTPLLRRVLELKGRSPVGFLALADGLAGDAGKWVASATGEPRPERFDQLADLATLFHLLMDFDARDRVWARHCRELGEWLRAGPASMRVARKDDFWSRCETLRTRLGIQPMQVRELHQEYFRSILEVCPEEDAFQEIRGFASSSALRYGSEVYAALTALEEHYQRKQPGPSYSRFGPEELRSWGFCNARIDKEIAAAEAFESFLRKFPDHPLASEVGRFVDVQRQEAERQRKSLNPVVYPASGPAIILPKVPAPKRAEQPSGPVKGRFDWEDPIRAYE